MSEYTGTNGEHQEGYAARFKQPRSRGGGKQAPESQSCVATRGIGQRKVVVALDPNGQPMCTWEDAEAPPAAKRWNNGKPRKKWPLGKIACNCNLVLKDIERLIEGEFGGPCDTDDADLLFDQALPFLVARHIAYQRSEETLNTMEWAWQYARKLVADHPRAWFEDAEQRILAGFDNHNGYPSIPDRDLVSRALCVTMERKAACGLLHLPAIERPPAVRLREAKETDRVRSASNRLKAGATPRKASREARKPWDVHGVSRSTYYRLLADGKIVEFDQPMKAEPDAQSDTTAKFPVLRLVSA